MVKMFQLSSNYDEYNFFIIVIIIMMLCKDVSNNTKYIITEPVMI